MALSTGLADGNGESTGSTLTTSGGVGGGIMTDLSKSPYKDDVSAEDK